MPALLSRVLPSPPFLPLLTHPPPHFYMKFTQPLFIQSLMGLKGLYDSKIIQVVLLGKKEERPFKVASMFGGTCFEYFVFGEGRKADME